MGGSVGGQGSNSSLGQPGSELVDRNKPMWVTHAGRHEHVKSN